VSRAASLSLAAAGLVVAVVLFLVLRPDDESTTPTTIPTTTRATTTQTAPTRTTTTPTTPEVQRIRIDFRNGSVVGGIRRARVEQGERVRLVVRADLSDEVHLHGYDISRRIRPGAPTLIVFRATAVGVFEVELEERHIQLAEIEVRP
jgi:hypothetical protein